MTMIMHVTTGDVFTLHGDLVQVTAPPVLIGGLMYRVPLEHLGSGLIHERTITGDRQVGVLSPPDLERVLASETALRDDLVQQVGESSRIVTRLEMITSGVTA